MSSIPAQDKRVSSATGTPKKKYETVVPSLFSVVSWGCAGTAWLARALNSHPDVFCVQGANHYLQSMRGMAPTDGLDYMHVLSAIAAGHAAVGDVHGISRHLIPELRENYGAVFSAAVLVRDPLLRVRSQLALFKTLPDTGSRSLGYVDSIAERAGLQPKNLTQKDRLKLHAFNMLNSIIDEQPVGPIYRIEDLTRKRASMASLLHHLTSGKLKSPGWWLDYVLHLPTLNAHNDRTRVALRPADIKLLSRVVKEESKELYRGLGYVVDW